jgi:hypothetical protein
METTTATRTAPGHRAAQRLTTRATVTATALRTAPGTRVTALTAPRLALMAAPQRTSPRSMTRTSIFAQWAAADRIDGGGRALIAELEGSTICARSGDGLLHYFAW